MEEGQVLGGLLVGEGDHPKEKTTDAGKGFHLTDKITETNNISSYENESNFLDFYNFLTEEME